MIKAGVEWLEKKQKKSNKFRDRKYSYIGLLVLAFSIWLLVYLSGGTKYAVVQIIYILVLASAFLFDVWGGFFGGILSGILVGPLMPLVVKTGEGQESFNWIIRMIFFIVYGVSMGHVLNLLSKNSSDAKEKLYYNIETGLPNEEKLIKDLTDKINNATEKENFCLITLNIENYFKIINAVGYDQEKKLLQQLSACLEDYLKENQQLYISYKDKYEIVLLGYDEIKAVNWIKEFMCFIDEPIILNKTKILLKMAVGFSIYPEQGEEVEEIIQNSYFAMENSREEKKEYKMYNEQLKNNILKRFILLGEIKNAIKNDEFELYYQPKLNLENGKINGAEALIRWNHPTKGFISPDDFIPQVEKTHLINPLTYWVLNNSIKMLKELQEMGLNINLSINLVSKNFEEPDFVEKLFKILDTYKVSSKNVELEITERDIMKNDLKTKQMINEIKKRGFKISIDDFGTGYSSLAYFTQFPADIIKIDRSFISNLHNDEDKKLVVDATIRMSHAFNRKVIAEGIEKKEELEILKELNCESIQGYYVSKPIPKEEFIKFLQKSELE